MPNSSKRKTTTTAKKNKTAATPKKIDVKYKKRHGELELQIMPYTLAVLALMIGLCFIFPAGMGTLGRKIVDLFLGLFSVGAYTIPFVLINTAVFYRRDAQRNAIWKKSLVSILFILLFSLIFAFFFTGADSTSIVDNYKLGKELQSGGAFAGVLCTFFKSFLGNIGTPVISILSFIIVTALMFNCTPIDIVHAIINAYQSRPKVVYVDEMPEEEKRENQTEEEEPAPKITYKLKKNKEKFNVDVNIDRNNVPDRLNGEAEDITEENIHDEKSTSEISLSPEEDIKEIKPEPSDFEEAKEIFKEDEESETVTFKDEPDDDFPTDENEATIGGVGIDELPESEKNTIVTDVPVPVAESEEKKYCFPPISLLHRDLSNGKKSAAEDYQAIAEKLVSTLASFGVRTSISDIAHGPTVTRYELKPEAGVRVRSIVNLSDDIALNLAASGVRIECPIPGKEAVGIEIPNKSVSTVYIRDLIENPKFKNSESKISCCLGENVAGDIVICDIAKMPHILIAGATGMGKSVCINSMIISILYKADPEEVKFLLIDPKRVEFNIYNSIPHLLVPVLSEPKKAAGALCWAVSEMERRFTLIEEVGVRDLKSYNAITKNDPERESIPQIVIVIDELADLMLTARDEVETSICRLAQKARAAGIHLVIGTQRPSVDVITGLIKANIPSRIACTVASQVDSRTIIDIAGAEKLLGRGDMLYAPVGSTKPMRVQGAFVSDSEVESVVEFIKNAKEHEYDKSIMEAIEKEAARCGERGKNEGTEELSGAFDDPMLEQAIEVALEIGTISTSLLQRKLSLGYARAARLVDKMEALNIIGPFAGSKPREVLISRDQFYEMKMGNANSISEEN